MTRSQRIRSLAAALLAVATLAASTATGADYYVRPDGSDANSGAGASAAQAWATISYALSGSPLTAGDTLYVMSGAYTQAVTVSASGSSGSPLSIVGDTDGAVFGGAGGPVTIQNNTPLVMASLSDLVFDRITFSGTSTVSDVASITNTAGLSFTRCEFFGGSSGVYVRYGSEVTMVNCLVRDCGTAVRIRGSSGADPATVTVLNSTLVGSTSGSGADVQEATLTMSNCILADNALFGLIVRVGGTAWHFHNLYHNNALGDLSGTSSFVGDVFADPEFVGAGDYQLQETSPAIDAGLSAAGTADVDFLGAARPQGGGWDMGCFENRGDNRPVGHWRFNATSGTIADDSSGNNNDGTLVGGAAWDSDGKSVGAITLTADGADRVELPSSLLDGATDATFLGWFRTTKTTDIQAVISGANSTNHNEFLITLLSSGAGVAFYTGNSAGDKHEWTLPSAVADGQWRHLAVVRDDANDEILLYLDGVLIGAQSAALSVLQIDSGGLNLGEEQDTVGGDFVAIEAFAGSLDDVRIYRRALTADEVAAVYSGLVGHWAFDEGTGSTIADASHNANNASFGTGSPTWIDGVRGKALEFDGTNDAATGDEFDPPDSGAVAFWFRSDGPTSSRERQWGVGPDYETWQDPDGLMSMDVSTDGFQGGFITTTPIHTAQTWYHIIAQYDSTTDAYEIYLNGQLHKSGVSTHNIQKQAEALLTFGTRTGSSERFRGALDDFRVYDRWLSPERAVELYGLVGHWKLDEASGATAVDSSLFGVDLTHEGTPVRIGGPRGGAVTGHDANEFLSPPGAYAQIDEAVSAACFFRINESVPTHTAEQRLMNSRDAASNTGFSLQFDGLNSTNLLFRIYDGGGYSQAAWDASGLETDRWSQAVGTFDGSTIRLYVDGQLVATQAHATGLAPDSNRFRLAQELRGAIDDAVLYNRAMTQREILEHYGLVGHYELNETAGLLAADSSGLGNHGAYVGSPTLGASSNGNPSLGTAVEFDGANHVAIPGLFDQPESATIAGWARFDTANAVGAELVTLGDHLSIRFGGVSTFDIAFYRPNPTYVIADSGQSQAGQSWRHFAAVYNSYLDVLSFYVGGQLVASEPGTGPIDWGSVGTTSYIARHSDGQTQLNYVGYVDDVRVYNRALTADEVQKLYYETRVQGLRIIRWVEVR